ncbi:putative F-box protein [Sesamum alatum]|uniref:F-box protein n=1 Tax=Sesamum alatum TaxID=300844 RepID=A0AAE2CAK2_9LAMI|nr:putative F-box protein [Sesamum alatum]
MQEIPSEVLGEILSRLPAESLLRIRCVCKAWQRTIDDPVFTKLHLHRQLLGFQDSSNGVGQLILIGDLDTQFYSLPMESLNSDGAEIVKATIVKTSPLESYRGAKPPVGSCNGVVLISQSKGINFLWNPLTGEFHRLPPLKLTKKSRGFYHSVSGLGYDSAADDYKVVKVVQVLDPRDRRFRTETMVYSLKLDSWRRIKDFPYRIWQFCGGIFLKGALHWISSTMPQKCMDDLIIGLDLGTEDYSLLPLPSKLSGLEKPSSKHLGVLGGCLILRCHYQIERLDVWLMEDYGVESSWIKLFSVAASDNIGAVETLMPIAYSKCKGQVLLQHNKEEFLWFDLGTRLWKKIRIDDRPTTFCSRLCLASLVRLNVGIGDGGCNNGQRPEREKGNKVN